MSNEKVYCDFHPGSEARWYCVDCHHYLCESCVEERRLSRRFKAYVHSLEECRGKCVPLNAVLKQASAVKALTPSLIREPKPSFLTRHYQWRFYLGLAGVFIAFAFIFCIRPPRLYGASFTMFYLLGLMLIWGLLHRSAWAAHLSILIILVQSIGYLIRLRTPAEIPQFIISPHPAFFITIGSLLIFVFALGEFVEG
ncbi:B-box zinc finger protein [Candidatus Sumerlaeota bacterium]|nr:B-box zinc finger protein [Candidatus Sumerlaeota bacterium]